MMPLKRDRKSGGLAAMTVTAGRECVGCWSTDSDRSERREALSKDFLFATSANWHSFRRGGFTMRLGIRVYLGLMTSLIINKP